MGLFSKLFGFVNPVWGIISTFFAPIANFLKMLFGNKYFWIALGVIVGVWWGSNQIKVFLADQKKEAVETYVKGQQVVDLQRNVKVLEQQHVFEQAQAKLAQEQRDFYLNRMKTLNTNIAGIQTDINHRVQTGELQDGKISTATIATMSAIDKLNEGLHQ